MLEKSKIQLKEKMAEVHGNRTHLKSTLLQDTFSQSGARCGAVDVMELSDSEYLLNRWPDLSTEAIRMILAVVKE